MKNIFSIVVETKGGLVIAVYSNIKADVHIIDWDNFCDGDEEYDDYVKGMMDFVNDLNQIY